MEEAPPGRCAMLWSSFAARVLVAEQTGGLMGCWEQTQLCRGDTILGRVTGWESCRKIGHEVLVCTLVLVSNGKLARASPLMLTRPAWTKLGAKRE
eukprot:scaffold2957_cov25-Tisochrysis_lutea.AAC.2